LNLLGTGWLLLTANGSAVQADIFLLTDALRNTLAEIVQATTVKLVTVLAAELLKLTITSGAVSVSRAISGTVTGTIAGTVAGTVARPVTRAIAGTVARPVARTITGAVTRAISRTVTVSGRIATVEAIRETVTVHT
jgi:hypothetical protein